MLLNITIYLKAILMYFPVHIVTLSQIEFKKYV